MRNCIGGKKGSVLVTTKVCRKGLILGGHEISRGLTVLRGMIDRGRGKIRLPVHGETFLSGGGFNLKKFTCQGGKSRRREEDLP